jgi:Tfp pilus assembly protein PilF
MLFMKLRLKSLLFWLGVSVCCWPAVARAQMPLPTPAPARPFKQTVPFGALLYYEEALVKFKQAKAAEGLARLKEAVKLYPEYFDALLLLAQEAHKQRDDATALEMLERARRVNDRDGRVYRLLGVMLATQGKLKAAEMAFRASIQREPGFPQGYQLHAQILLDLALLESDQVKRQAGLAEAERQLTQALSLSSGLLPQVYLTRARLYEARNELRLAAQDLENYLKLQPATSNATQLREKIGLLTQP